MRTDYIEIGATPSNEDCAQVGQPNYAAKARMECEAFLNQIRRMLGSEPEGARLLVKANPHDFGTYYEVACKYEVGNEAATAYAYRCEAESPQKWDEQAMQELNLEPVA